jgi:hypothetical protein
MDMLYFSNKFKEFKQLPPDDLTKVNIKFNKSQIINEAEIIDMLISLVGMVSKETLLKLNPLIDDPDEEMEKIANETAEEPVNKQVPIGTII